jgi:hypothetical protein
MLMAPKSTVLPATPVPPIEIAGCPASRHPREAGRLFWRARIMLVHAPARPFVLRI